MKLDEKMYSTKMINTGGRSGEVHSPDHSFELSIAAPGKRVENATNPEQLLPLVLVLVSTVLLNL